MFRRTSTLAAAAALLTGCSMRVMAVRQTAKLMERGLPAVDRESDPEFAAEAFPAQLKTIEVLLENDPGNVRLLSLSAQGYAGYSLLFVEDSDPIRARELYLRARDYGLRALERTGFSGLRAKPPADIEAALKKADRGDAGPLFWTALAWAGWINLAKDDPQAIADLPRSVALMARVAELEPKFFYGGPDLFFGVYHGRPKVFGGDLAKSKSHFDQAAAASDGRFLLTFVKEARIYAVAAQDRDLFNRLLERVIDAPADLLPEARLANEVARVQAKNLLEQADELFE